MGKVVGIDLGTTYSVVAYVDADGRPQVIPNDRGKPTTPSVIYFAPGATLVGDDAKERQAGGATEVASFFKRHMGEPHFVLQFHGRDYTPVDLSALVLGELKRTAERFFGEPVTEAVITVPAYFTHVQRRATMEAGGRAGLRVLSIISEPTAAALAYGLRPSASEQLVLVYDLGGGTFDISLVRIGATELTVIATDGDHHLGGRDWDDRLVEYLQQQFHDEFGQDLVGDDFNELLVQAEALKRTLSARQAAPVRVQAGGNVGTYEVARTQFDALTRDLMERTQRLTEQVLEEAHVTWRELTGVLPVGGSTRMPMVREYIERMSGRPPMGSVNPDEAVALGAAIQASLEKESRSVPRYRLTTVRDVVAHGLGMIAESEDRARYVNSVIIPKNLPIPATQSRPYAFELRRGGENRLEVFITQGESADPQDCTYLGLYVLTGFPPHAEGKAVVDISYVYDRNAVVAVTAKERATGTPLKVAVEPLPPDVPERFLGTPKAVRVRRHATVYLAFDVSGSMSGHPLAEAQKAAEAFVSNCDLSTTSIGLIAFSDRVQTTQRATQNAGEIRHAIRALTCGQTGGGNSGHPFDEFYDLMHDAATRGDGSSQPALPSDAGRGLAQRVGGMLAGGARGADDGPGRCYGIVLADGVWENQPYDVQRAKRCHAAGIEIIAIGFGGADERFLRDVASSTEQGFFTDLGRLTEAFTTIAQELTESDGESRVGSRLQRR